MPSPNSFLKSPFANLIDEQDQPKPLAGSQAVRDTPLPTIPSAPDDGEDAAPAATPVPAASPDSLLPPPDQRKLFEVTAAHFQVPVNVLMALAHQESGYNAGATNKETGAAGPAQYLDATAKSLRIDPRDPNEAIPAAAMQIRQRLDKGYSMADAIKEHFAGPDRKKWGEKTAAYGDEVLTKAGQIGQALYGDESDSAPQPKGTIDLGSIDPSTDLSGAGSVSAAPQTDMAEVGKVAPVAKPVAQAAPGAPPPAAPTGMVDRAFDNIMTAAAGGLHAAVGGVARMVGRDDEARESDRIVDANAKYRQAAGYNDGIGQKSLGIAGSVLPALALPEGDVAQYIGNAGLFAKPAFDATYKKKLAEGYSQPWALAYAAKDFGINLFLPMAMTKGAGAVLGHAAPEITSGIDVAKNAGRAAAEGAGFSATNSVSEKLLDAASGHQQDTPWLDPADMTASALAFGGHRAVSGSMHTNPEDALTPQEKIAREIEGNAARADIDPATAAAIAAQRMTPDAYDPNTITPQETARATSDVGPSPMSRTVPLPEMAPQPDSQGRTEPTMGEEPPAAPSTPAPAGAPSVADQLRAIRPPQPDAPLSNAAQSAVAPTDPNAGPLAAALTDAAAAHAANPAPLPEQPAAAPPKPDLNAMSVDDLRARLKQVAQQTPANSAHRKTLFDERRTIEKEISLRGKQAAMDSKPASEPLVAGPFEDMKAANKMMQRFAVETGVPHEVVGSDGKFSVQPVKGQGNGIDTAGLGRGTDGRGRSGEPVDGVGSDQPAGRAGTGTGTVESGGPEQPAPVPEREDHAASDPVVADGAANHEPALTTEHATEQPQPAAGTTPAPTKPAPVKSAGERMRERVETENPFMAFLATHGIHIDERSDTGGQNGKAGIVMVPGYGALYRKSGARIDELAALAHDAGFLSDADMENSTDNGGTRKLAELIARAVHAKEVVKPASDVGPASVNPDHELFAEAAKLGIDTEGKSADQVYDVVVEHHDAQFDDEQARIAAEMARDADIPLDGGTPSSHMSDEDLDAIFPTASSRDQGQDAGDSTQPAPAGAQETGQPGEAGSRTEGSDGTESGRPGSEPADAGRGHVTETPEFKHWFGDSKVRDADGKPMVVYHATTGDFDAFDRRADSIFSYGDAPDSGGIFFTSNPKRTEYYAHPKLEGSRMVPVYLRIENPAHLSGLGPIAEQAKALHAAEAAGHDGAFVGDDEFVVFKPEQIKSATGNDGKFDPANPSILKERKDDPYTRDLFGGQDLFDHIETRPGTLPEQKAVGRAAVSDLARRLGVDRIDRNNPENGSRVSVLGSRLLANFVEGKPNQLVGQRVNSPHDLASLAQVYRDPRFETFRVFYVGKGGEIVGEAGYTSRMAAAVHMPDDLLHQITNDKARFVASGFYLLHNHPSGRSEPSQSDIDTTHAVDQHVPGFLGHVVIDHNEYSVIHNWGEETIQAPHLNGKDFTGMPEMEHAMLGVRLTGPSAVARAAKALQIPDGHATLVLTTAHSETQLIVDLPMGILSSLRTGDDFTRAKALVRRMARETGSGGHRFIILPDGADIKAPVYLKALAHGIVTDVVNAKGESLGNSGFYRGGDFIAKARAKVLRTNEGNETLEGVRAAWADAGIKNFMSEKNGVIHLSQIIVPKGERDAGKGTDAMRKLVEYADRSGQRIVLTPSADFGGSKSRLTDFYKRFGFVENKGRNKDFEVSESMYRDPANEGEPIPLSGSTDVQRAMYQGRDTVLTDDGRLAVDRMEAESYLTDDEFERSQKTWQDSVGVPLNKSDAAKVLDRVNKIQWFHGSALDNIDSLDLKSEGGLFLSSGRGTAQHYAGADGKVYEPTLNIKKPFFVEHSDATRSMESSGEIRKLAAQGFDAIVPLDYDDMVVLDKSVIGNRPLAEPVDEYGDRTDPQGDDSRSIEVDGRRRPIRDSSGRLIGGGDFAKQQEFWRNFKGETDENGRPVLAPDDPMAINESQTGYGDEPDAPAPVPESTRAKLARMISRPVSQLHSAAHDIGSLFNPMVGGSEVAQAFAKDFANQGRKAQAQWNAFDTVLRKNYTDEQLTAMWHAADQENDLRREGQTSDTRGLNSLPADHRETVEVLHQYGEQLWNRAKRAGLVDPDSEGVAYWTPRVAANIYADGSVDSIRQPSGEFSKEARNLRTSANSTKQRKYDTTEESEAALKSKLGDDASYVKNIRVMPMAMAQLEKAIAGRTLVNQIKAHGQVAGEELVSETGGPNFVTFDHPALKRWMPVTDWQAVDHDTLRERGYEVRADGVYRDGEKLATYRVNGDEVQKLAPMMDSTGKPILRPAPLFVHKDFEGPLKAVFSKDYGNVEKVYRGMMAMKGAVTSVIMVSPLTHNLVIWGKALPTMTSTMGWKNNLKNLGSLGFRPYFVGNTARSNHALMNDLIEAGMVPVSGRGMNQDIEAIANGLKPGRSLTAKALGSVFDLASPKAGDAARKAADKAGEIWHEKLLWDRVADMQTGMAVMMRSSLMDKGIDQYTASRIAGHFANRYAGMIPQEAMSKGTHMLLNLSLFSKSFTGTNVGAYKDLLGGLPGDVQAQIRQHAVNMRRALGDTEEAANKAGDKALSQVQRIARTKAAAVLTLDVAAMATATSIAQAMMQGQGWQQFSDDFKKRLFALGLKTRNDPLSVLGHPLDAISSLSQTASNPHGKEDRVRVGEDEHGNSYYMRLPVGKVGEELKQYGDLTTGMTLLHNKLSTFLRPLIDLGTGKDVTGKRIILPHDNILKQAAAAGAYWVKSQLPIDDLLAVKNTITGGEGNGGTKIHTPAGNLTMDQAKTVGWGTGLSVSKLTGGDAVAEMRYQNAEQQAKLSDVLPDVKAAIQKGDQAQAVKLLKDTGQTPNEIGHTLRSIMMPGAMTKGRMNRFIQHASPEEVERVQGMMQKK